MWSVFVTFRHNMRKYSGEYESLFGWVSTNTCSRNNTMIWSLAWILNASLQCQHILLSQLLPRNPSLPAFFSFPLVKSSSTCLWRYLPSNTPCLALFLRSLHEFPSRFKPLNIRCTAINYLVLTNFIYGMSYTDSRAKRVIILDLKAVEPVTKNK